MSTPSRRVQRHLRPNHVCCYIGPIHVSKTVYDVWCSAWDVVRYRARRREAIVRVLNAEEHLFGLDVTAVAVLVNRGERAVYADLVRLERVHRVMSGLSSYRADAYIVWRSRQREQIPAATQQRSAEYTCGGES